ncbi:MAG: phosphoribosylformylglycinamidine synthase subunit PurL [Treponema sp.]|nr:MAG: phosphoribosylformylglycinamidine synthase subunit PurL [Treponema sp.]
MNVYRFLVKNKNEKNDVTAKIVSAGFKVDSVEAFSLYFVLGNLSEEQQNILGKFLFSDELFEVCEIAKLPFTPAFSEDKKRVEVLLKPGVTDPQSAEAFRCVRELGFEAVAEIVSGTAYDISGKINNDDLQRLARTVLSNDVIQYFAIGGITPHWASVQTAGELKAAEAIEEFDIAKMSDLELAEFSDSRRAALDLKEMQAVREYYKKQGRKCTDAEFETIAQTWSEHCVHKTFKAKIEIDPASANDEVKKNYPNLCVDNILKTYIKKATDEIAAPWVLSAFVDNAGIIEFDDNYEVSFKAETHNHPSAIEPFGGANTGVGGVIRDVMGVSARPFALTDILCFGKPETPAENIPEGSLHPKRIIKGVVEGVQDYGNKMGIPNVNGSIHFHSGYATNPLVYCGCAGIAKRGVHKTTPSVGDYVIAVGGRTGRDGIRGATFSSMIMDASTGDVAGSSVQIGEPIIQKTVCEFLETASNEELYSAITDCGAGGFSSAIGEMASELGCEIELSKAPLKYAGLKGWEIWVSESQERMVLAVPEANLNRLIEICEALNLEFVNLGKFTGNGVLKVNINGKSLINLDCSFLHSGPPQRILKATPKPTQKPAQAEQKMPNLKTALLKMLSHDAIASNEDIVRLYDHEVQGGTILRQYEGLCAEGPQDAAVIQPREINGQKAVAISNALNFRYGLLDCYKMTAATIDEAVRNAVSVGADPEKIGILDNFCMGDPKRPEVMWDLIECARACYNTAVDFGTPFISGKDSFNNEYLTSDGKRAAIPASLLISAMGIVPDIDCVPGSDFKQVDNEIYLIGNPDFAWGGSVFAELFNVPESTATEPPIFSPTAVQTYKALHKAIIEKQVLSCHDVSDGGIAIAVSEMIIGGKLGAVIHLDGISKNKLEALFAETCGCLIVEINPKNANAFTSRFEKGFCTKIGRVQNAKTLRIERANELLDTPIEVSYEELRRAYLRK